MKLKEFNFDMADGMPLVVSNNCFSKFSEQSKVYGMCGTSMHCAGGGGSCGTSMHCAGGGGRCGTSMHCAGE